jgi:hypothetical protein
VLVTFKILKLYIYIKQINFTFTFSIILEQSFNLYKTHDSPFILITYVQGKN